MDNLKNEPFYLDLLANAETLWEAAEIANTLERFGTNEAYPAMAKALRRFAMDTLPKRPRFGPKTPRIHSNQQIFEASLAENWDGITEQGLLEAVTDALWPCPIASFAASRLAEIDPAYAVLPRIMPSCGERKPIE